MGVEVQATRSCIGEAHEKWIRETGLTSVQVRELKTLVRKKTTRRSPRRVWAEAVASHR
jgi:hypothetical protein